MPNSSSQPAIGEDRENLLSYTRHLERQSRRLETEKQMVEGERLRLQRELNNLRAELDRLRAPPLIAGSIVEVLDEKYALVKSTTGPSFVVSISSKVDREALLPNVRVALNQRSFSIVNILPSSQDASVRAMELIERPEVSYNDIGGLDEQIVQIREAVELPLIRPDLFEKVGIRPPSGLLLWGPPGTGKTLLAKAVAFETDAVFIQVIASEFVQKFIGEGARIVREVFEFARERSPAILFVDELDAIGSKRMEVATSGDREVQRTLMQLLSELDGFKDRGDVKVIAATNRPDILDTALLRPGRFDRIIEIPMPVAEGREEIIKIHTRGMNITDTLDVPLMTRWTEGFSGADISSLCTEAGMFAIRDKRDFVTMADFKRAIQKVTHDKERSDTTPSGFT